MGISNKFKVISKSSGNNFLGESSTGFIVCCNDDKSNYYVAAFNYRKGISFDISKIIGNVSYTVKNEWGTINFEDGSITQFYAIFVTA